MSWTKRQFIERAYANIGLGKKDYVITAEDYEDALRIADSMVSDWQSRFRFGVGWPVHDNPDNADADEITSVPITLSKAVWSNLSLEIASSIGRQVLPQTKTDASQSFKTMIATLVKPKGKQLPKGIPLGAGNRWRNRGRIFSTDPEEASDMVDNEIEGL